MILVKNSILARTLKVEGIVLYPFVFFASKKPDIILINHEMIHVQQIKQLGVFSFYYRYLKEYMHFRRAGLGHWKAYRSISFEVEAYEKQNTLYNPKTRPLA